MFYIFYIWNKNNSVTLNTHTHKGTQNSPKNVYFVTKAVEKPRAKAHKGKCGWILKTGRGQNGRKH